MRPFVSTILVFAGFVAVIFSISARQQHDHSASIFSTGVASAETGDSGGAGSGDSAGSGGDSGAGCDGGGGDSGGCG